jgi:hypothetical protein
MACRFKSTNVNAEEQGAQRKFQRLENALSQTSNVWNFSARPRRAPRRTLPSTLPGRPHYPCAMHAAQEREAVLQYVQLSIHGRRIAVSKRGPDKATRALHSPPPRAFVQDKAYLQDRKLQLDGLAALAADRASARRKGPPPDTSLSVAAKEASAAMDAGHEHEGGVE